MAEALSGPGLFKTSGRECRLLAHLGLRPDRYAGPTSTISHSPPGRKVIVFGKQDIKRREASRFADRAANEILTGHQPQDCKGARDRNSADPACDGQPGDRMNRNCPRYASAAIGNRERFMKGNLKVSEYLNKALRH